MYVIHCGLLLLSSVLSFFLKTWSVFLLGPPDETSISTSLSSCTGQLVPKAVGERWTRPDTNQLSTLSKKRRNRNVIEWRNGIQQLHHCHKSTAAVHIVVNNIDNWSISYRFIQLVECCRGNRWAALHSAGLPFFPTVPPLLPRFIPLVSLAISHFPFLLPSLHNKSNPIHCWHTWERNQPQLSPA